MKDIPLTPLTPTPSPWQLRIRWQRDVPVLLSSRAFAPKAPGPFLLHSSSVVKYREASDEASWFLQQSGRQLSRTLTMPLRLPPRILGSDSELHCSASGTPFSELGHCLLSVSIQTLHSSLRLRILLLKSLETPQEKLMGFFLQGFHRRMRPLCIL